MDLITQRACFLPQKQSRLANLMWSAARDCFSYCIYFNQIKKVQVSKQDEQWFTQTQNAYYDLAVINWCKLFGSDKNEPIHYKKLLTSEFKENLQKINVKLQTRTNLRAYILETIKISEVQYKKFHKEVLNYRNRGLIHPEHDPDIINDGDLNYPTLKIIIKTSFVLLELLSTLLSESPASSDKLNKYRVGYYTFKTKKELMTYIQSSFPTRLLT